MNDSDGLASDLALAFDLARRASDVALALFRRGVAKRQKPDGSIVTDADIEVERQLLALLAEQRPDDAVLSEESGEHGSSPRRWILDPIDGTSYFAAGKETWGTHVALEQQGQLVLGVITRPVAGQCCWATRGGGAHHGALASGSAQQPLHVSSNDAGARARVMSWSRTQLALNAQLRQRGQWVPPTLDGVLDLAAGRIDALLDDSGFAWDIAPAVLIVEEAGGRFVDREGGHRIDLFGGWFTNGRIDAALGLPPAR